MQRIYFSKLIKHGFNQQSICLHHYLRVTTFHTQHNIVIRFISCYPQKFHGTFHHTYWRIAIAAHNSVAQRTMIGTNPHSSTIFFTNFHQWCKPFSYSINFFCIFGISIFNLFKFFLVNIITRIHPYLLNNSCCYFCSIRSKMNIGHNGSSVASFAKLIFYVQ